MNGTVDQGSPSLASVISGILIMSGILVAGLVLWVSIQEIIQVFFLKATRFDLPRSIVFQTAVSGYLLFALIRRLVLRDLRLRISLRSILSGFARAWGIGVAILVAANVADVLRSPTLELSAEVVRDLVLYAMVILILLIPSLLASTVAQRIR